MLGDQLLDRRMAHVGDDLGPTSSFIQSTRCSKMTLR